MNTSKDSPIFIVGCMRSGTSLLRNLLSSHPRLTFPHESNFIPKLYRAYGDPRNAREARRLATKLLKLPWVRRWEVGLEPEGLADCRSYREMVSRIFEAFARKRGRPRWGDKTPGYAAEIPTLVEIFPSAKILHIYRDGRDVALSWIPFPYGPSNTLTAAVAWRDLVRTGRRDGAALPAGSYLEVRYEALLTRLRETMERVCDFIEEPFTDAVLRPTVYLHHRSRTAAGAPPGPQEAAVLQANHSKWKHAMPLRDRVLFESVAGDLLEELGYETEGHSRRIMPLEHVRWRLHSAFREVVNRLKSSRKRSYLHNHLVLRGADIRYSLRSVGFLGRVGRERKS